MLYGSIPGVARLRVMDASLDEALGRLDLIYVQHRGRLTGAEYSTEVAFGYEDGNVYLLAHGIDGRRPDWLANIVHADEARFYAGTRLIRGAPELLSADWYERILPMLRSRYGGDMVRRWYTGAGLIPLRLADLEVL
ncbi:MAG: DUF385 domain-containing protein [Dehalococcoidia bacterium]|nr:DUF385 domain-containing protein [Dehalococcoidia bacterium]